MNRLYLTLKYPKWRLWADYFVYFYNEKGVVCILDTRTDEIVNVEFQSVELQEDYGD